ncbi:1,4-dihydroxy-2-naphthoate octaprenyltransferase [Euzebyella saccharophila]|uniref:1,4-dihydroxy-2-naphthoate octaprenyltransferase n=1 Tax=Euzebyella saccharophila TaxID=679664 RepID=A0ABV8JXZ4_9FLAO|nr:1,4-dihydroxy-2-naphthoate octaprenyltransferase [Euzebyella saccharophila]
MTKFKAWVNAARLRTLPLSVSGILVGTALAGYYGSYDGSILFWSILTTIAFQITSNFANDYGDGVKGTDNEDRIGPKRALQSGILGRKELKNGIIISILIDIMLVLILVYQAFGLENIFYPLLFIFLGGLSIWAAIKYTVGNSAYGYRGLGDLFVFLFFGILAVLGSMFLYTKEITVLSILPAIAIGALSTGVLNLNNLRDFNSDSKANKKTMVVKMGLEKGKRYHYFLLLIAFVCVALFNFYAFKGFYILLPLIAFIPVFIHLMKVYKIKRPELFDPELKKLALSTFFLAVLLYVNCNIFL